MDPNVIAAERADWEWRIYGDDSGDLFAIVDPEDYQYLLRWKWSPKVSRGGKKIYLRRTVETQLGPPYVCLLSGKKIRNRVTTTLFLHHAVMQLKGDVPPSEKHTMVDHRDGDPMNCKRDNLRWATPAQNRANIRGTLAHHVWDDYL